MVSIKFVLLFVVLFVLHSASAKGRKPTAEQKAAKAIKAKLDEEKRKIKGRHCAEIEGDHLLFNCLHYNLDSECFL